MRRLLSRKIKYSFFQSFKNKSTYPAKLGTQLYKSQCSYCEHLQHKLTPISPSLRETKLFSTYEDGWKSNLQPYRIDSQGKNLLLEPRVPVWSYYARRIGPPCPKWLTTHRPVIYVIKWLIMRTYIVTYNKNSTSRYIKKKLFSVFASSVMEKTYYWSTRTKE